MRFTKMKNMKQEDALNALAELPPAPDEEMLAAFAKAMRVVAAKKTFDEMSVLDVVEASGFTSRTFYNHFRSKYDLLFWSYVSEDYRALQMPGGDCPMRTCRDWIYNSVRRIYNDRSLLKGVFIERSWEERLCETYIEHCCRMACNFIVRRGAKRISCDTVRLMRHYFAGNIHESALWLAEENPMPVKDFAEFLVRAMPAPLAKLLLKDK